jgi:hypothetical protein
MKYRKLIEQSAALELLPFYINSTPQGIYSFDLTELAEPVWTTRWMPATSEFSNRAKVEKLVGYLLVEDAIKL